MTGTTKKLMTHINHHEAREKKNKSAVECVRGNMSIKATEYKGEQMTELFSRMGSEEKLFSRLIITQIALPSQHNQGNIIHGAAEVARSIK